MSSVQCPKCGEVLDCHTCVNDPNAVPTPGAIMICASCTTFCRFTEELQLTPLTAHDVEDLSEEEKQMLLEVWTFLRFRTRKLPVDKSNTN